MSEPGSRDHYSYSLYADPEIAQGFDRRRFSGPIGELVASEQARVLADFIGRIAGRSMLDVGTGTGRAAILMARAGAQVTGVDASEEMLALARQRAAQESLSIHFTTGDVHDLQFPDRAFDVVISLRLLMHAPDWPRALAELCRVTSGLVIIDYPSSRSFAALQAIGRRMTHALGARNEPYRVLSDRAVAAALTKAGFSIRGTHRQFVLPIAFHKLVGSRRFTLFTRSLAERLGLLRLFGSPVTLVAERWTS